MAIQENAINGVLAEVLKEYGLHASPELAHKSNRGKRCDVEVRLAQHDIDYVAVECKIAQGRSQKKNVVENALRWLNRGGCTGAIGVCYPEEMAIDSPQPLAQLLKASELLMVRIGADRVIGRWNRGGVHDLIRLCRDLGGNDQQGITDTLKAGIMGAAQYMSPVTGKQIARILELPWDEKEFDRRPSLIACLVISNMILLQNRLTGAGKIEGLRTLMQIRNSTTKQALLNKDWILIQKIDYAPVVDPALGIIEALPTGMHTEDLLTVIVDAVVACAPRMQGLQFDHAGPLYHGLLETARYDGSFYTSTPAAVLLSELAMPYDWQSVHGGDWQNIEKLTNLKICDPACGTGTLLMASAKTIEDRYIHARGNQKDIDMLHLGVIEDVLHGMDINRHAIHLSAAMLTAMAPKIDYNKINLYNMWHGIDNSEHARAGSIELLTNQSVSIPEFKYVPTSRKASASGYTDQIIPDLSGTCDLVIMNPPFTRNDIRNKFLLAETCKRVQGREKEIADTTPDKAHRDAISSSSGSTFFTPIADKLVNDTGTVAMIVPYTVCIAPSSKGQRALLTDRFHVEVVVTIHDSDRIFFSQNTGIHETMVVARRKKQGGGGNQTAFVSLLSNPTNPIDAHFLADAIKSALCGDSTNLSHFGTIAWRTSEQMKHPWNAACFYDQELADLYDQLTCMKSLAPVGDQNIGIVGPGGRATRGCFEKSDTRQHPDRYALWDNKSELQIRMNTKHDTNLVPKAGVKHKTVKNLWDKRSRLLLPERLRLNLACTSAVYSDKPILGSAFTPVRVILENKKDIQKAWCLWFNSTLGILSFLNIRQKQLTYPSFSIELLRSLPVPHPDYCDIRKLADAFDKYSRMQLRPLPEIYEDEVRHKIDLAILEHVPNIPWNCVDSVREKIALEPTIHLGKPAISANIRRCVTKRGGIHIDDTS